MQAPSQPAVATTVVYVVVSLLLVLLNGFFVLVEFALVKIRRTRLEELVNEGRARARLALKMHRQMDEYLSATQLGITVASLGLGWIGEPAFAHIFAAILKVPGVWSEALSMSAAIVFAFCLITFLHILIGELAPKSLAIQRAEKAILWAAPLMRVFYLIFYVPLITLTKASNGLLRLIGFKPTGEIETAVTNEELRQVLAHSQKRGEFSLERLLLFEKALDFAEQTTAEAMLPLSQVDVIDTTKPWEENLEMIREKRHSRYPIAEGDKDAIIGILHIKDLAERALEHLRDVDFDDLKRDVFTVMEKTPLESLLREFQTRRLHMALVKKPAGEVTGVVTLEDLLEQLVGEIVDEFDVGPETPVSLIDFINQDRIRLGLTARDAKDAITQMTQVLASDTGIDVSQAIEAVLKRERDAPTGLGRQIAVPHARLPDLRRPCIAFARFTEGIDFKASDGAPARLVFLILSPQAAPVIQVKLLARIAHMVQSDYVTSQLQEAQDAAEVVTIVETADTRTTL